MSLNALPVSTADVLQLQTGILCFTDPTDAAIEAARITAAGGGVPTVYSDAEDLLADALGTSQVAVAVDALMYGVTPTSAELTKIATVFEPPQIANAIANGYNPVVYAAEATGLAFAFGNETPGDTVNRGGDPVMRDFYIKLLRDRGIISVNH